MFNNLLFEPWTLDYEDVLEVRALFKELGLPMELALEILNYAEYWPTREFSSNKGSTVKVAATMFRSSAAGLCLEADVFNDPIVDSLREDGEKVKIKAIEFHIRSRDQGWTSEPTRGTFSTSSWLEASILRGVRDHTTILPAPCWLDNIFTSPQSFQDHILPTYGWQLVKRPECAEQGPQGGEGDLAWYLQGNRVATQGRMEDYDVLWTHDDHEGNEGSGGGEGFLHELKEGDRLLVWARAKVCYSACGLSADCVQPNTDVLAVAWMAVHRRQCESYGILWFLMKCLRSKAQHFRSSTMLHRRDYLSVRS